MYFNMRDLSLKSLHIPNDRISFQTVVRPQRTGVWEPGLCRPCRIAAGAAVTVATAGAGAGAAQAAGEDGAGEHEVAAGVPAMVSPQLAH
jgi:hypothetical protein